ncbi:unnamed protein product [Darwinula stevensoni]|uniref:Phosphatidic acid phosphatase type 2/haloperoxidase domain-containing protein n=1 Tax=Darwinula stevensoni TaxID=69355 RepID=A0A7R9A0Y3_9CRUS|nr:unnamed protein product [Darwinula stevensoni]CAG0882280.1 unnamed protein product [Darwinula stevensoni]
MNNTRQTFLDILWKGATCASCLLMAVAVSYSRVYLLYHTTSQVMMGVWVGIALGVIWFGLVHYLFTPIFPVIANWPICKFFLVKDTTNIPNLMTFEFENVEQYNAPHLSPRRNAGAIHEKGSSLRRNRRGPKTD